MYKYVQRRLRDFVEKTYAVLDVKGTWNCNKDIGCNHRPNNNNQTTVVRPCFVSASQLDNSALNAGIGQTSSNQTGSSRKEECHKEKTNYNGYPYNLISAITWSSALVCGYYASQLLCLNRRQTGWDNRCIYTKLFLAPNRAFHTSLLARAVLSCPFPHTDTKFDSSRRQFHHLKRVEEQAEKFLDDDSGIFNEETSSIKSKSYRPPDIFEERTHYQELHNYVLHNVIHHEDNLASNKNPKPNTTKDTKPSVQEAVEDLLSVISNIEFNLGVKAINAKDFETAVSHFKLAAGHHHASATFNLGICFEKGIGVTQDLRTAMECYQAAAELHHPRAIYNLGIFYAQGLGGLKKNRKAARRCFVTAAQLGVVEAKLALGIPVLKKDIIAPKDSIYQSAIHNIQPVLVS